jgi:hypothetical protein
MTDKALDSAAAQADTSKLSKFDGKDVVRTTISVSNAGDGLSEALAIDPQEFHHGDEVFVVIHGEIDLVSHRPLKDAPTLLIREHRLKAGTSTIVDGALVADVLAAQREKIAEAKAKAETEARRAKGEYNLDDEALLVEHGQGQHKDGLREGCPACDGEVAADAAEKAAAEAEGEPAKPTPISKGRRARGSTKKSAR